MDEAEFRAAFARITGFKENPFHPLVWIIGEPTIGRNVHIGGMSEVNAKHAKVTIGDDCDIASFVAINAADSHKHTLGLEAAIARGDITLENNVFVGSHSVIKGGSYIGHHSVIAASTVVSGYIPPYSLVAGNPMVVKPAYYEAQINRSEP